HRTSAVRGPVGRACNGVAHARIRKAESTIASEPVPPTPNAANAAARIAAGWGMPSATADDAAADKTNANMAWDTIRRTALSDRGFHRGPKQFACRETVHPTVTRELRPRTLKNRWIAPTTPA